MMRISIRATLAALAIVAVAAVAQAADPAPTDVSGLSDAEIDRRIQFLEERLDDSRTHGQIWHYSWLTINTGSMVGNGVAAVLTNDHDDTVSRSVSSALGAIGVASIYLRPLEARYGSDPVSGMSQATREDKLAKLRAAEDQLRSNAERSEKRWDWREWAYRAGLSTTAGLIVGLWGETGQGIYQGFSTMAGSAANLLTQPWGPKQDWQDYLSMTGARSEGVKMGFQVTALPDGEGAKLSLNLTW